MNVLGIPSKGRLKEQTLQCFEAAGLMIGTSGDARGYRGAIEGLGEIEVGFLSATEIAHKLKTRSIHAGITGADLLGEVLPEGNNPVEVVQSLDFGHADVVVAVPEAWLDVNTMADLDDVSIVFYSAHGRRLRVATKYPNLTRRFFAAKGVTGYRIVESLGATEGAPGAGSAEIIVDITSTGATLKANHLKVLNDGVLLNSQAVLATLNPDSLSPGPRAQFDILLKRLGSGGGAG